MIDEHEEAEAQFSRDVDDDDPDMPPPGGGVVLAIGVIVATWIGLAGLWWFAQLAGKLLGR